MVVSPRSAYSGQSYRSDRAESAAAEARVEILLAQLCRLAAGDADRIMLRAQVIEACMPMAARLARKYAGRGEPVDDLTQVALMGLISAVDRFDIGRGVPFGGYATPTILGAIKRHFRDTTWSVRVPRRIQELTLALTAATEELTKTLRRAPTIAELAIRLDVSAAAVSEALLCANSHPAASVDATRSGGGPSLAEILGSADPQIEAVDRRDALRVELAAMPERDQRIIGLRFFADMSQSQIAIELGISQMHVSRLLARALADLRHGLADDAHASESRSGKLVHKPVAARRAAVHGAKHAQAA